MMRWEVCLLSLDENIVIFSNGFNAEFFQKRTGGIGYKVVCFLVVESPITVSSESCVFFYLPHDRKLN